MHIREQFARSTASNLEPVSPDEERAVLEMFTQTPTGRPMTGVPFAFKCDTCGFEGDLRFAMGSAPETTPCPALYSEWPCPGTARRVFKPLATAAFPGSHRATYPKQ